MEGKRYRYAVLKRCSLQLASTMVLPRAILFESREVSEAWKRLKAKSVDKTIAGAKINIKSKQGTNENISKDSIN